MGKIKNGFAVVESNLKIIICRICGKNILIRNAVHLVSCKASIKTTGKNAKLFIGYKTRICPNAEISTRGIIKIGDNCFINRNCIIAAHEKIIIENNVTIGPGTYIYDHDHDGKGGYITKPIIIGDGTWIGAGCIILKGVTIGKESVVAAGSVVVKDVPSKTILLQKRTNEYVPRR